MLRFTISLHLPGAACYQREPKPLPPQLTLSGPFSVTAVPFDFSHFHIRIHVLPLRTVCISPHITCDQSLITCLISCPPLLFLILAPRPPKAPGTLVFAVQCITEDNPNMATPKMSSRSQLNSGRLVVVPLSPYGEEVLPQTGRSRRGLHLSWGEGRVPQCCRRPRDHPSLRHV